jgi:hypothetical protein
MANEHIETYLNDHLAGSTAAVELLEHLETAHGESGVGQAAAELRAEIEADRQELRAVMGRLEVDESRARKASGWLASKVTELKLRLEDRSGGALHLFESLEALSLGIEGKHGLWRALEAAAQDAPSLQVADYERLAQRAVEQRSRVEEMRLEAARKALVPRA